jgi:hypothetical protein
LTLRPLEVVALLVVRLPPLMGAVTATRTESKYYKIRDAQYLRLKHFPSAVFPLIHSAAPSRHDCPVLPLTSPGHHDPRCTPPEEIFSGCLPCSYIGFQSTCAVDSHNIPASLYRTRRWVTKLQLHQLWELLVSSI